MKSTSKALLCLFFCSTISQVAGKDFTEDISVYYGASDASAAVAINKDTFILADDENNVLRVYKTNNPSVPVSLLDLSMFLAVDPEHPETDIEGATMVGDRIYWITSHGRNKNGKMRTSRYRFFATRVKVQNQRVTITPVGIPCQTLVHNLVKTNAARQLGLQNVTRFNTNLKKQQREILAPKRAGLNIEGLCASADGNSLFIGFRNPRPYDTKILHARALVVPLNNPRLVIEKGGRPVFGAPILWNLGGLGIRSMEYSPFHKSYFIVAGPHNEQSSFALYRWSGEKNTQPALVTEISTDKNDFTPEALAVFKGSNRLLLLSDDGSIEFNVSNPSECMAGELLPGGKCKNKHLTNAAKKQFKGAWLQP
ncbi:MAG: DUF3616 domain-containing protein [Phycisphaerae bacterium]|nr:DUF3616 domain-containing protein [Phycisphaerae bacterium]NIR67803.1 DUF3616 domain-containing protein [candidate division Zixibacteria bacterium]NIP53474.1 DUF3616 domain-containing protein [Phycisphaerae bacterium]NIS52435.1 DUF3616 domain-containing protein [Phycisphaerae bacterium]NIU09964.1 DUF3616 domain-containing protein [Phycisphaerae bacterium]